MARKNSTALQLSAEKKAYMLYEIKNYFIKEREEDLGDLAAELILGFIAEKLAPEFYNQGIADAYKYMDERLEEVLAIQK
ncbi:MAG: DUF2164 domain-containing protein [bacterium]